MGHVGVKKGTVFHIQQEHFHDLIRDDVNLLLFGQDELILVILNLHPRVEDLVLLPVPALRALVHLSPHGDLFLVGEDLGGLQAQRHVVLNDVVDHLVLLVQILLRQKLLFQ